MPVQAEGPEIFCVMRMRRLDVELADPAALKGGWQPQLFTSGQVRMRDLSRCARELEAQWWAQGWNLAAT